MFLTVIMASLVAIPVGIFVVYISQKAEINVLPVLYVSQ